MSPNQTNNPARLTNDARSASSRYDRGLGSRLTEQRPKPYRRGTQKRDRAV